MADWLNLGEILRVNAGKFRGKMCLKEAERSFTFEETNSRVNRLARGFMELGLKKGDRVAVFLENSVEICEVYFAAAKTGVVVAPINFRLDPKSAHYIVDNSDARALVVHDEWAPMFDEMRSELGQRPGPLRLAVRLPVRKCRPGRSDNRQGSLRRFLSRVGISLQQGCHGRVQSGRSRQHLRR